MKIGLLGSGSVATTLAAGFLKHGHSVQLGTRDPGKLDEWKAANPGAQVGSFADAAAYGEVLVLAVKGSAAADALRAGGVANLAGKPVLDATNPIADAPPINGVLQYFTSHDDSLMERLQREFPQAQFVKCWNSVGAARMVNPSYEAGRPTMFICGNDPAAKATATKLLDQFGWDAADMGKVEAARAIEPLAMLWCILGFNQNEWTHAFRLLRA
ncbi:MAG: NAD(P)-binding domain-containing protein [Candidatus Eisenbacteria bacterium]|nr:NAD(P)-binding domain-containing protein [Candidatus Eisenbacteria bacterium]